jgi:ferritin-like metal-binding protein YciE
MNTETRAQDIARIQRVLNTMNNQKREADNAYNKILKELEGICKLYQLKIVDGFIVEDREEAKK